MIRRNELLIHGWSSKIISQVKETICRRLHIEWSLRRRIPPLPVAAAAMDSGQARINRGVRRIPPLPVAAAATDRRSPGNERPATPPQGPPLREPGGQRRCTPRGAITLLNCLGVGIRGLKQEEGAELPPGSRETHESQTGRTTTNSTERVAGKQD